MELFLLLAYRGLVGPKDRFPRGSASLPNEEVDREARRVGHQLKERDIRELYFLINPSNGLALTYLRLIVLACDRAKTSIELLDERARHFADWSKSYRQAEEAYQSAKNPKCSVEEAFSESFRILGNEDGILWFQRGLAFMDRKQPRPAVDDFEKAAQLFPMKEWRDRANENARSARKLLGNKQLVPRPSLDSSTRDELTRLARPPEKKLVDDAVRVADLSSAASILLSFAAVESIRNRLDRRLPEDLNSRFLKFGYYRNDIAHGPSEELDEVIRNRAYFGRKVLLDFLRLAHNDRSKG